MDLRDGNNFARAFALVGLPEKSNFARVLLFALVGFRGKTNFARVFALVGLRLRKKPTLRELSLS